MDREKGRVCSKIIRLQGVVQGVGFRPTVYRLAQQVGISGWVKNTGGAVEIAATGTEAQLERFIHELEHLEIPAARIEHLSVEEADGFSTDSFVIAESSEENRPDSLLISADLPVCKSCLSELADADDRRYRHPFNTCVSCGPRFSVIRRVPYDRNNTSMDEFPLCDACSREYHSPGDRRFHAETISCHDCGPSLLYQTAEEEQWEREEAFQYAQTALSNGKIIAVKGIGGYHLACSPFSQKAVRALRALKGRDEKPFAVMFADLPKVRQVCRVTACEEALLTASARPITLLPLKSDPFVPQVLCGDLRCGCFLPYTPLHHLLLEQQGMLVMTSANKSGQAIIKDDEEMLSLLRRSNDVLAGVLYHRREIVRSLEDSVVQCVGEGQTQMIRRARGYVPEPIAIENPAGGSFLAMGGDLKASFCLVKEGYAWMSQYFGDLEEPQVFSTYQESIQDFETLFSIWPTFVLKDTHPGYFSSRYAQELQLPQLEVQHHHAHIASVMAEHHLDGPVIGVAFDGTGYGDDGAVWGGEFLLCEGAAFQRVGHLAYTKLLGGDSSAKDAQKTSHCFLYAGGIEPTGVSGETSALIKAALQNDLNTVLSSSMGRLFDAASALLGICEENGYEGQCAIQLQRCAERARRDGVSPAEMTFGLTEQEGVFLLDSAPVIQKLYEGAQQKASADIGALALGFHDAVAQLVAETCGKIREREGCRRVVLSGGVFQNQLLLELCLDLLAKQEFLIYINQMVPPGDGGIALGQAYLGAKRQGGKL